jgi:hypothetical protein
MGRIAAVAVAATDAVVVAEPECDSVGTPE